MKPLYVWYSPKLDRIEMISLPQCRESAQCRWDRCAYIRFYRNGREAGAFYYMGEL